jgi:hypothetical protein
MLVDWCILKANERNIMKNMLCRFALIFLMQMSARAAWHELLLNNGFEQGAVTWSAYAIQSGDPLSAGIVNLGNAHNGSWYAYVGDYNTSHFNATGAVRQVIFLPSYCTTATLNFYLNVTSQETAIYSKYDRMGAYLRTYPADVQVGTFHEWSNLDKDPNGIPNRYAQQIYSLDVSAYAGTQIDLQFYANTDSSQSTTFRIDDVSLQAYVPDYTIGVSAGPNGMVTPSGNVVVESGQTLGMTATPSQNYIVDKWYVNGYQQATGNTTLLLGVNANATVYVTFKPIVYTVSVSAGANGTVSPSGAVSVNSGDTLNLTASPAQGYVVDHWTLNGTAAQQGGTSYSLKVTSQNTVDVSFTVALYTLNVAVYGQGTYTVNPSGGKYALGTMVSVISTPGTGYQFSEWTGSQYSRNPSFSFAKGGADENLNLYFVPPLSSLNLNITVANSTPATIGLNMPTPPSWLTILSDPTI